MQRGGEHAASFPVGSSAKLEGELQLKELDGAISVDMEEFLVGVKSAQYGRPRRNMLA